MLEKSGAIPVDTDREHDARGLGCREVADPRSVSSGDAPPTAISISALTRSFVAPEGRVVRALGPVDLDVRDGEFVCIVGPSGCGKSTLLRIVAGLVAPSQGTVEILTGQKTNPTAMVFQDYSIYPWKDVRENVRFGLDLAGVQRAEGNGSADRWISQLGLAEFADAYPSALSGGMRQRVSIARALAVEPDILLMDEPFAALDAQLRRVLQQNLLDIWQTEQRTVLFVTHSLEEAITLGDRVVVMSARPGRILGEFDVPLGRPRDTELRTTPEFSELESELWHTLESQVEQNPTSSRVAASSSEQTHRMAFRSAAPSERTNRIVWSPGEREHDPQRYYKRRRRTDVAMAFGVPLALLALWQIAGSTGLINTLFYPTPSDIAVAGADLFSGYAMWEAIGASSRRVLVGFAVGSLAGLFCGVFMGMLPLVRTALDPLLSALYTVPKLALLPIFVTMFGLGDGAHYAIIGCSTFFFVWISTMTAIMTVAEGYREAAVSFGATRWQVFRAVLLPGALPQIFVGLRIAAGVSVLVLVGSEFVLGGDGLGDLIEQGRALFLPGQTYLGIFVVAFLGVLFSYALRVAGRHLSPWAREDGGIDIR